MAKKLEIKLPNGATLPLDLIAMYDEDGNRIKDTYLKKNEGSGGSVIPGFISYYKTIVFESRDELGSTELWHLPDVLIGESGWLFTMEEITEEMQNPKGALITVSFQDMYFDDSHILPYGCFYIPFEQEYYFCNRHGQHHRRVYTNFVPDAAGYGVAIVFTPEAESDYHEPLEFDAGLAIYITWNGNIYSETDRNIFVHIFLVK